MQTTTGSLFTNRIYLFLLTTVLFMHLASYFVIPILPVFLETVRGLSISQIGLLLGANSIAYQAGSLLGGVLSDRLGRRNVMVIGSLIQAAAMLGYSSIGGYVALVTISTVNGIGVGLLAPTLKAKIADVVSSELRTSAFSWRGIAANAGIAIAGVTVTFLALSANSRLFVYAAVVFGVLSALTFFLIPNDRCVGDDCHRMPLTEYRQIFKHRSFLYYCLISLLIWALYAQFALVIPLRGSYVLGSATSIGLIWTINSVVVVLFQGLISRFLLERVNPYIALAAGTFMLGLGLFSLGWAFNFITLSASAILFIIGEMLFLPVIDSLVGHFAKPEWLGAYFGLSNMVAGIGGAIGNSAGGAMLDAFGGVGSRAPWVAYGMTTLIVTGVLGLYAYYAMGRYNPPQPDRQPLTLTRKEKAK
ncbi:MFS transporter [Brevibacillus dissolubilis]|uniref:MFS transporter n=1 Tax=Brevibacillus dissolubilis TaxID=1844116 RepID=UPI0011164C5F|nr:MFS transporter [Brevibacillus dissolubilis]